MAVVQPIGFSPHGEYLAIVSPDGTLKIWDTASGSIKQDYTPSSHLSATCSCLTWSPGRRSKEPPRKKKKTRKSLENSFGESPDLIALGTTSGSLLLYSVVKGDLQGVLEDGHSRTVNDVCWSEDGSRLYSCSRDHYIAQWELTSASISVKQKWKADKGSVNSLCLCQDERYLLCAGRSIKLWDLTTMTVVKTFTGHANPVFCLATIPSSVATSAVSGDEPNIYVLSAATNDRLIHVWHSGSVSETTAIASFTLPSEPVHLQVSQSGPDQPVEVATVTKDGELLVFEHVLNGPVKRPVIPRSTIQIATEGTAQETPHPIPILAAHLCQDLERNLLYTHGNFLKLTFEKLKSRSLEASMCLIRKDPSKSVVHVEEDVTKVRTPQVNSDVTVLAAPNLAPSGPIRTDITEHKGKKKRRKSDRGEMSLNERLSAISIDKPETGPSGKQPPKADTLATLLTQGLQSKDKKILHSVLQNNNDTIIRNTVSRLSVQAVVPLIQELAKLMQKQAQEGHRLVKWMRALLTLHTSYLMTFPELVDLLSSMYSMMESRTALHGRLTKLQGKLHLILAQLTDHTEEEELLTAQQPMLLYQDESSDEDITSGDLIPDESGDDWEEAMSDKEKEEESLASSEGTEDEDEGSDEKGENKEMNGSDQSMDSDTSQ